MDLSPDIGIGLEPYDGCRVIDGEATVAIDAVFSKPSIILVETAQAKMPDSFRPAKSLKTCSVEISDYVLTNATN